MDVCCGGLVADTLLDCCGLAAHIVLVVLLISSPYPGLLSAHENVTSCYDKEQNIFENEWTGRVYFLSGCSPHAGSNDPHLLTVMILHL